MSNTAPVGHRLVVMAVSLALLAACTSSSGARRTGGPIAATSSTRAAALQKSCEARSPTPAEVVAFVSGGRAWAMAPEAQPACLFELTGRPGFFEWGPRADRVVLDGLEVRGVGSTAQRPASGARPTYFSWSRPTGTTIIYTDDPGRTLRRADMGSGATRDISPLPSGVQYGDMAYHPSGLAIGFVADAPSGSAIWMSSNQGKDPQRLVFSDKGTRFTSIVFDGDGTGLFYGARLADGTRMLARLSLPAGTSDEKLWVGSQDVLKITQRPGMPGVGLDVGSGCRHRRATYSGLDGTPGADLLPGTSGPTSVVGRLDADSFIVAAGGCDGPLDIYIAKPKVGSASVLVRGVERAALRVPEPTPAPPLPAGLPRSGFA